MKSLFKSFAAGSLLVATSTVLSVAMAGGTPAGFSSGANISGSASLPSLSMQQFAANLTAASGNSSILSSGSTTLTMPIQTPSSLSSSMVGYTPGTQITLQGPSGTSYIATVGPTGTIETVNVIK